MTAGRSWASFLCLAVLLACLAAVPAVAQLQPHTTAQTSAQSAASAADPVIPDKLTPADVDRILAELTDAQVRQLLSGQLREKAAQQAMQQGDANGGLGVLLVQLRLSLERLTDIVRERAAQVATGMALLPDELAKSIDKGAGGKGWTGFFGQIGMFLGLLAVGVAVHLGVRRLTGTARRKLEAPTGGGLFDRVSRAAFRAAFELFAVAAFAIATLGLAVLIFDRQGPDRTFVITYLTGALITYGVALTARFVLAPFAPALRLVPLGDGAAGFLYRWAVLLSAVAVFSWLTAGLYILTGMALEAHLMVVLITGAIMVALTIVMVLQSRAAVAAAILGPASDAVEPESQDSPGDRSLRTLFSETWHIFAILYMLLVWLLWGMSMLARGPSTIWAATASVGALLLFPILDRAFCRILTEVIQGETKDGGARSGLLLVIQRGVQVVIAVVLGLLVLQLWDVNLSGDMGAQAQGALLDASFDIVVAAVLAYLGWQLIKVGIDRRLQPREVDGVMVEPNDRLRTLLPLARKFLVTLLVIVTVMLVLSGLGVNIGPLLAGAGVVGIAIGFGAQTLVRDVVSGIFFLVEDAFRVGEYVETGTLRGEVESIGLRSMRLRHHRGPIHTVPFGELRSITNHNRDWVIYKMNFRVPFDTEIDKVKKLMKQVGAEMLADPDLGPRLIETVKSQGVSEIDDSALIIRVKFMCYPREQFILRREAYKRIKAAFEANGIEFASRKVEIHSPGGGSDGKQELHGGAAAAVAQQESGTGSASGA